MSQKLLAVIDLSKKLYIQTHDFPDHDAVAAAAGLQRFLRYFSIEARLCYGGIIQSESLKEVIQQYKIDISSIAEIVVHQDDQIIVVDGIHKNRNVANISGTVVAVIDHHQASDAPETPFTDIRPEYGSCSTIIYEYFTDENVPLDPETATVLLTGIMMDTAFMTRGVHPVDLKAFSGLFFTGSWENASFLLKNSLSVNDLPVFQDALSGRIIYDDVCFVHLEKAVRPEIMGLLGDFLLRLKEVLFIIIVVREEDIYKISVRSEDPDRSADKVIRTALEGIGSGGGHIHMGGGAVALTHYPGKENLQKRFLKAMEKTI